MTVSAKAQEVRDFTDALRGALGLAPLYRDDSKSELAPEKFFLDPHVLPEPFEWKEWFQPAAAAPSTRSSFRDLSVGMALKRKTLRFEQNERRRA